MPKGIDAPGLKVTIVSTLIIGIIGAALTRHLQSYLQEPHVQMHLKDMKDDNKAHLFL